MAFPVFGAHRRPVNRLYFFRKNLDCTPVVRHETQGLVAIATATACLVLRASSDLAPAKRARSRDEPTAKGARPTRTTCDLPRPLLFGRGRKKTAGRMAVWSDLP